ncbi:MAG TPA: hypothetical protein VLI06_04800 [Solimonas sp.]|nr:hypothetical protein [Solimonas sp.]
MGEGERPPLSRAQAGNRGYFGGLSRSLILSLAALCCTPAAQAQDAAQTRMRDQLKQTILQLRAAQDELAKLKMQPAAPAAAQPEAAGAEEIEQYLGQIEAQSVGLAKLQAQLEEEGKARLQMRQSLEQAEAGLRERDTALQRLQAEHKELGSREQACYESNGKLVSLGEELVSKYRDKSVWQSLLEHEPLTGLARVELEQAAQDFRGRIVEATLPPPAATPKDNPEVSP